MNMTYKGKMSPKNPYVKAENAVPPVVAAEKNPRIAPLFPSGRANIIEALKTVFPAQLRNAPKNIQIHTDTKFVDWYAKIQQTTEIENPRAIIQYFALDFNFIVPSKITQRREATVVIDIRIPYCPSSNPFSIVKGSISVNGPAAKKFNRIAQGIKMRKQEFSKTILMADFASLNIPPRDTFSP